MMSAEQSPPNSPLEFALTMVELFTELGLETLPEEPTDEMVTLIQQKIDVDTKAAKELYVNIHAFYQLQDS